MSGRGAPKTTKRTQTPQPVVAAQEPVNVPSGPDPLDFETLPLEALRKYRLMYRLGIPSAQSLDGWMLSSPMGQRTASFKTSGRVSKSELAAAVKRHFLALPVKEGEMIVDFIYSVRRQDQSFKLQFNRP